MMRTIAAHAAGRRGLGGLLGVGLAATLAVGYGGVAGAASGSDVTATLGAPRAISPGFFGINYDYGGASIYVPDPSVAQQLGTLRPGTLRWPAGTGANYFQWKKGYPVAASPGGSAGPAARAGRSVAPSSRASAANCTPAPEQQIDGFRFTLADLATAYRRTRAAPIFDLNVMTAGLTTQIAMLKAARDTEKLPVKYLELGNEFYLCDTDYVRAFPTAKDYGRVVAADVKALHKAFPGALVAAVGAVPSGDPRTDGWNVGVLAVATGTGKPDVITLHTHPRFDQSLTASGLPGLFTEPYTSAAKVRAATGQFPGTPAWITEYGLSQHWKKGNSAQLTYANALFENETALLLVQKVRHAALVSYWSAFGPALNYAYAGASHTRLTPVGLAMTWLDDAARGATSEAPIVFSGGPRLGSSGDPALVGARFATATSRREMLVNLSAKAVTVRAGAAIPSGASYRQATGNPIAQVTAASKLTTTSGTVGRSITLAPYSLTLIG